MAKPSQPRPSMLRRHPILTAIALLTTVCLAAACVFLATFDLNTYKESLANRLSTALAQPVSIGSASMSWRRGPVFDISALRIGEPNTEPIGEIAHLFLQPRLLPLLRGKVVFANMTLDRPRYKLDRLPTDSTTEQPISLLKALLQTVQVHNLAIIDGQLNLDANREDGTSVHVQARAIELKIRNLLTGRPGKLQLSAELLQNREVATLRVKGRIAQDSDMSSWRQARGNLQLHLENIDAEQIFAWFPQTSDSPKLKGKASLTLTTEGSVVDGLHCNASLSGPNLALAWPSHYQTSPRINNFTVAGIWTATENLDTLSELNLQLNNLGVQGHLSLQRDQDQPWLEGTLSSPALKLADLREFIPDSVRLAEESLLQSGLEQGTVQVHHLRLAGPLQHLGQTRTLLPIADARITLRDARLPLPSAAPLEQLNADLTLRGGDLHLNEGTALLMKSPVRFSGTTTHLLKEDQIFSFSAEWDAPATRIWNDLATPRAWRGKAYGIIPVTVSLTGPRGQLHGNLQANLARCVLDWPGIISKPAGSPAEFRLSGYQQNQALIIEEGLLSLSPCDLQITGSIGMTDKVPLDLRLKLPPTDLQKADQLAPILATYRPEGTLTFDGQLSGPLAKPSFSGQARLNAGALAIDALEAKVRDINGTITLSDQQCRFTDLQARLGQSPLRLDGTLSGGIDPAFTLHFKAPRVGAGEIIFPGSKEVFRNLNGILVFTRDRIRYENILFDLGSGTGFKLEGSQGISSPILAELNIHAKKASIDDVVALWEEDSPVDGEGEIEKANSQHRIVIQAGVDEGLYGNLLFSEAKGTVVAEKNTVAISPLTFMTGSGSCQAEVIIDNSDDNQSMLAISGQMKDIDAAYLHNELLRHQGLVTGKLNGWVQLQGPAGPELLTRGKGKADIHIKDGVLRKFSFLSKVFSLLNVSQIFTLHLPDMASHGMPFTSLDGSVNLDNGRLTTEDLVVASNAMNLSLVGNFDLKQDQLDLLMGVKPFATVDKIVSKIPLAGWILTGENKSLITAQFRIQGPSEAPDVAAIPITSVSEKVIGIFQRVLGLPGKMVSDVGELFQSKEEIKSSPPAKADNGDKRLENRQLAK